MEKENGSYYYGVIQGLGFRVGVILGKWRKKMEATSMGLYRV